MDEYVVILNSGAKLTIRADDYYVDDIGVYFKDSEGVLIAVASHPVLVCFPENIKEGPQ